MKLQVVIKERGGVKQRAKDKISLNGSKPEL